MSEIIALALASLPVIALFALVVLALRTAASPGDFPPVDLLHRSYGA